MTDTNPLEFVDMGGNLTTQGTVPGWWIRRKSDARRRLNDRKPGSRRPRGRSRAMSIIPRRVNHCHHRYTIRERRSRRERSLSRSRLMHSNGNRYCHHEHTDRERRSGRRVCRVETEVPASGWTQSLSRCKRIRSKSWAGSMDSQGGGRCYRQHTDPERRSKCEQRRSRSLPSHGCQNDPRPEMTARRCRPAVPPSSGSGDSFRPFP
jgi:hypothetical protein